MAEELKIVADLRIYSVEDRVTLAGILAKNGYCVSQLKKSRGGNNKACDYYLRVREDPESLQTTR